jgi:hypothetical protein
MKVNKYFNLLKYEVKQRKNTKRLVYKSMFSLFIWIKSVNSLFKIDFLDILVYI